MFVLVINTGSSSFKYRLYDMPAGAVVVTGTIESIGRPDARLTQTCGGKRQQHNVRAEDHDQAMVAIFDALAQSTPYAAKISAVGHRVVHGTDKFTGSVILNDEVIASLEQYADLAPLHNPINLIGIRAAKRHLPNAIQVGCFDTAFHTSMPRAACTYPLPWDICLKYGIRRYGFHGTSHRYVAERAARLLGKELHAVNLITCHLGGGCSITAIKQGRSIDTSMGFTSLEGLVMGTRSGDFDPAIIFYLNSKGYDLSAISAMCNKQSGLLGISGISNDMRTLADLAAQGNTRAQLAIEIFCYRIKKYIGAYTSALDTVDALVFTGGIGENAVDVRRRACTGLTRIGIEIDDAQNTAAVGVECRISTDASRIAVFVIPTDEEAVIARDTFLLAHGPRADEVAHIAISRRSESINSPA